MITQKKLDSILQAAESITVDFGLPYYEINTGDIEDDSEAIILSLYPSPETLDNGDSDADFTRDELLAGNIIRDPEFETSVLQIIQDGKPCDLQFFEHKVIDLDKI